MQNVIMAKVSVQKEFDENITAAKWIVKGSLHWALTPPSSKEGMKTKWLRCFITNSKYRVIN